MPEKGTWHFGATNERAELALYREDQDEVHWLSEGGDLRSSEEVIYWLEPVHLSSLVVPPKEATEWDVFSVKDKLPEYGDEVQISYDGGKTWDEQLSVYLERRVCAGWADGGSIGSFGEGFATSHDCPAGYGLILDNPTHWRYPSPSVLPAGKEEEPVEIVGKPLLVNQYADNGEFSHWHLIDDSDGKVLWSSFPEETEAKGQTIAASLRSRQEGRGEN